MAGTDSKPTVPTLSSSSLSSNDRDVIERGVVLGRDHLLPSLDWLEYFDISECELFISNRGYERIALQFPDALLPYAFPVANHLRLRTGKLVFILGDTSYGSCCVDEVAAEHANADCVIHFGKACLSLTRQLPVHYSFGKRPLDVKACVEHLSGVVADNTERLLVFYDTCFEHCSSVISSQFQIVYPQSVVASLNVPLPTIEPSSPNLPNRTTCPCPAPVRGYDVADDSIIGVTSSKDNCFTRHGRIFQLPRERELKDYKICYLGDDDLFLTNLMMNFNVNMFVSIDPSSNNARYETLNVNRALMRRYYLVQKAKDADVVGIVVGTLGVADYLHIISRLKSMLKIAGKKFYTFIVGKINIAKLANFMEIDVFVLVACPENTLIDSQDFYRPIVTPFEMEVACSQARKWTGEYITDFRELLPGAASHIELQTQADVSGSPRYSFITGELRSVSLRDDDDGNSTEVVSRNQNTDIAISRPKTGAEFLASRSWKGLDNNDDADAAVCKAVEGRSGISTGYSHEPLP